MDTISNKKIKEVVKRIVNNINPEKIILFGSYATGNFDFDSDLDILVVKETEEPRHRRGRKIKRHLRGLKTPIDIIVCTSEEIEKHKDISSSLIKNILEEGEILYERKEKVY